MRFKLLAFFLQLTIIAFSQTEDCGAIELPGELLEIRQNALQKTKNPTSTKQCLVTVFIVRKDNGSQGVSFSTIEKELEIVNEHYSTAGLEFITCGAPIYIDNTAYHDLQLGDESIKMRAEYYVENTINIYFVDRVESRGSTICGTASFPTGTQNARRIIMKNSCLNGSTLSHELGHFYGLSHTHSTVNGKELVNGSNCTYAGDQICDTPADPKLSGATVDQQCNYSSFTMDPNGDRYTPDPNNIMSYSRKRCRFLFSEQQSAIIKEIAFTANEYIYSGCVFEDIIIHGQGVIPLNASGQEVPLNLEIDTRDLDAPKTVAVEFLLDVSLHQEKIVIFSDSLSLTPGEVSDMEFNILIPDYLGTGDYKIIASVAKDHTFIEKSKENNIAKWNFRIDFSERNDQQIMPNPVADYLTGFIRKSGIGKVKISIVNASGQVILNTSRIKTGSEFNSIIDVSFLVSGVYFARYTFPDEEAITMEFIKI